MVYAFLNEKTGELFIHNDHTLLKCLILEDAQVTMDYHSWKYGPVIKPHPTHFALGAILVIKANKAEFLLPNADIFRDLSKFLANEQCTATLYTGDHMHDPG